MFEHVTRHYQTLNTWIGHNATRYHNFNALPHALPYIFYVYHGLELFATGYHALPLNL